MAYKFNQYSLLPIGCLAIVVILSGCTGKDASRAFGLQRSVPDEYTVTTRSPLSMPPSEDLLLPSKKSGRPQETSIRQQTLEILSPDIALEGEKNVSSPGQSDLMSEVDASTKVERNDELQKSDSFVNQIMFWKDGNPEDLAVDSDGESQRLKSNLGLGMKPTQGATPVTMKKSS